MAAFMRTFQDPAALRSGLRFAVVGVMGTLIDLGLFGLLHLGLGMASLLASILSYSAGIVNNYFWHRGWTFAGRGRQSRGRSLQQFLPFAGVSLSALAINSLVVMGLSPVLGQMTGDSGLGAVLAKLCALGVGITWNYLANHLWVFKTGR